MFVGRILNRNIYAKLQVRIRVAQGQREDSDP